MQANPYLTFSGQCREAFEFYARVLGGKIETMMPARGTPAEAHVPPEFRDKILHARLTLDGAIIMGADSPPDQFAKPQGFSVALHVKTPAEAERIFNALSQGGSVAMPLGETFWAARFGMCTDRFGTPWMVNCEKPH